MRLTPEQVWLFRHNGFLKLPERLPEATVEKLKEAIYRDIEAEREPVVRDRDGRAVRLSNLIDRDPIFWETVTSPMVLDPLESLLGPNIEILRNRHNHATLRTASAGGVYMHRDVLSWTREIVTIIFYLEETTLENGCTEVIPGTHLFPWTDHPLEKDENVARMGILNQGVRAPMPAGGMLLLDSLVFHSAGENRTDGTRLSMTFGYHSVNELAGVEDPKALLVRGRRIYQGNDRRET
jgi:ectoine hydroxylase-related dioxygenase (phytanoyl-CoA dioxygenase family)